MHGKVKLSFSHGTRIIGCNVIRGKKAGPKSQDPAGDLMDSTENLEEILV